MLHCMAFSCNRPLMATVCVSRGFPISHSHTYELIILRTIFLRTYVNISIFMVTPTITSTTKVYNALRSTCLLTNDCSLWVATYRSVYFQLVNLTNLSTLVAQFASFLTNGSNSDTRLCVMRPRKSHVTQVCYLHLPKFCRFLPPVS